MVGRLPPDFHSSYNIWVFVRSVLDPAPCRIYTENTLAPCPGAKPEKSGFAPHPGRAHPANHCCASPRPPQTPPRSLIPPAHSSRELSHNRRPHSAAATQGRLAPPPILASTQRRRHPAPPLLPRRRRPHRARLELPRTSPHLRSPSTPSSPWSLPRAGQARSGDADPVGRAEMRT